MKFYGIADEDTVRGLRLAGIEAHVATTDEQARIALNDLVSRPDCGIIIITEEVALRIQPQVDVIRLERDRPLIVVIPGSEGPLPGRKGLRQLVQEAVGVRVD